MVAEMTDRLGRQVPLVYQGNQVEEDLVAQKEDQGRQVLRDHKV